MCAFCLFFFFLTTAKLGKARDESVWNDGKRSFGGRGCGFEFFFFDFRCDVCMCEWVQRVMFLKRVNNRREYSDSHSTLSLRTVDTKSLLRVFSPSVSLARCLRSEKKRKKKTYKKIF